MKDEITINGEYVKKQKMAVDMHIVRTRSAGVFFGEIVRREGKEVEMRNARRIWYWDGAATLSQLAMEGTKTPDKCKFPCAVESIVLLEVIEILACTIKAVKSLCGVKIWEK